MYLRKLSFKGIKGAYKEFKIDFIPDNTDDTFYSNIEFFNLNKHKYEFGVLKQIALMGLNASGKTTTLIGANTGISLLSDPILFGRELGRLVNIFNKEPLEWKYEYVTMKNDVVTKYNIEIEWMQGRFIKEKVEYTQTDDKVIKPKKVLYELLSDNEIKIGDKIFNHNSMNSLYSLVRNGQIIPEINSIMEDHNGLFLNIKCLLYYSSEFSNMPLTFFVPPNNKLGDAYLSILREFDSNIVNYQRNTMGEVEFIMQSSKGEEISVSWRDIPEYFSKGTMSFITNSQFLLQSLFNNEKNTYTFDEVDSSVHSGLFRLIFELMRSSNAQYIFTTHSLDVLKFNLRKDQIIQIYRDEDGNINNKKASDIYKLNKDCDEKTLWKKFITQPDQMKMIKIIDDIFDIDTKVD